ncbi:MAG: hypothetical protein ACLQUT_02790 [Thermoleophilia bacterium]
MNVERRLLRLMNAGDQDIELFQRALAPRVLPNHGPRTWLFDRAFFLYITVVRMARAAAVPAAPSSRAVVYDPGARDETRRANRAYFIHEYFGEEVDFLLTDLLKGAGEARTMTVGERLAARRWRWRARRAALASFLDFSSRRYRWWGDVFSTVHTFAQALEQIDKAYIGLPYDRRSYVLATWLQRHTAIKPFIIFQSMPLYGNQRDLHVPVTVILTSKVNIPEVNYYIEQGHFKAGEVLYRSQEYLLERVGIEPAPPLYDIGFFSTGDWARVDGTYWAVDLEKVRQGAYRGNIYEAQSMRVLEALVDYARSRRRTLRIYLHPYERRLLNDEGIEPPYKGLADGQWVTIDERPGNSRVAHYEPDVAVALRSGTIWERIDLGLDRSFMYVYEDLSLGNLLPEAMGEYQRNLFRSVGELFAKLDECFAQPAQQRVTEPQREPQVAP